MIYQLPVILCLQGTLIRVYDTDTHIQLLELRRGAATANIYWYDYASTVVLYSYDLHLYMTAEHRSHPCMGMVLTQPGLMWLTS